MEKLWIDKYRPKKLEDLHYHTELSGKLQKLAETVNFPHMLFYGPSGAGKKTRIMCFLQKVYGQRVYSLKSEMKEYRINPNSTTKVSISILTSTYHLDISPQDAENYDRVILQKLIKEVASTKNLDPKQQKSFKVIIINDVDKLTHNAQAALRRTMEKYMQRCRMILTAESLGRVIAPLRSRCLMLRISCPEYEEIEQILSRISMKENFDCNKNLISKIALQSKRNLRTAILQLQACRMNSNLARNPQETLKPEWVKAIGIIGQNILDQQSPRQLKLIREKLYELLVNCIPGDLIVKVLLQFLLTKFSGDLKFKLIEQVAYYENKMQQGSKPLFHIEAMIARIMVLYKNEMEEMA